MAPLEQTGEPHLLLVASRAHLYRLSSELVAPDKRHPTINAWSDVRRPPGVNIATGDCLEQHEGRWTLAAGEQAARGCSQSSISTSGKDLFTAVGFVSAKTNECWWICCKNTELLYGELWADFCDTADERKPWIYRCWCTGQNNLLNLENVSAPYRAVFEWTVIILHCLHSLSWNFWNYNIRVWLLTEQRMVVAKQSYEAELRSGRRH